MSSAFSDVPDDGFGRPRQLICTSMASREDIDDEASKQDRPSCDPRMLTIDRDRIIVRRSWPELNQDKRYDARVVGARS